MGNDPKAQACVWYFANPELQSSIPCQNLPRPTEKK